MQSLTKAALTVIFLLSITLLLSGWSQEREVPDKRLGRLLTEIGQINATQNGELVLMRVANSARYQIDGSGVLDYARLLPLGHLVHLPRLPSDDSHISLVPHTPTIFHQLKCLGIYHKEYLYRLQSSSSNSTISPPPPSPLVDHCLNYLRQTILCRSDLTLESVRSKRAQSNKEDERICRDWTNVYNMQRVNQEAKSRLCSLNGSECDGVSPKS